MHRVYKIFSYSVFLSESFMSSSFFFIFNVQFHFAFFLLKIFLEIFCLFSQYFRHTPVTEHMSLHSK